MLLDRRETGVSNPTLSAIFLFSSTCKLVIPTLIPESGGVTNGPAAKSTLPKSVQTPHGWRYCRVLLSANGRVKPDIVVVNGKEERHTDGAYYLEWRDGAKRVGLSVGKDPQDAGSRRLRKEAELNAVKMVSRSWLRMAGTGTDRSQRRYRVPRRNDPN